MLLVLNVSDNMDLLLFLFSECETIETKTNTPNKANNASFITVAAKPPLCLYLLPFLINLS